MEKSNDSKPIEGQFSKTGLCANCGETLNGRFCSSCGQKSVSSRLTFRAFIFESLAEFLDWFQGPLFMTIVLMFRSPGKLTCEFLKGKRASYINPARLFMVAFGSFFLLLAILQPQNDKSPIPVHDASGTEMSQQIGSLGQYLDDISTKLEQGEAALSPSQQAIAKRYSAIALLLLVPFLAILLKLVYKRQGLLFPEHLVFSLHLHTYGLFLALLFEIIPLPVKGVVPLLLGGACYFYLVISTSKVYQVLSLPQRLLKTSAISFFYGMGGIFILFFLAIIAIL